MSSIYSLVLLVLGMSMHITLVLAIEQQIPKHTLENALHNNLLPKYQPYDEKLLSKILWRRDHKPFKSLYINRAPPTVAYTPFKSLNINNPPPEAAHTPFKSLSINNPPPEAAHIPFKSLSINNPPPEAAHIPF